MNRNITLEELILELMPFSEELVNWCKSHAKFLAALKNVYPKKFISPAMIVTSYPKSGDEIIGVYTYHHEMKNPIFKQDFIVNKGNLSQEFTLYSRNPTGSSKYVKDIKDFLAKYGTYGYDMRSHHLSLEELPAQLQERGREAIKLAEKMKIGVAQEIPQEHIDKIYKEVVSIKRKDRYIKQKLNS
ncbi:hypothetical protein HY214_03415 [Candidatus Roizmanbacteria bacterium]|nr:hypothetical protein [Candidatus Roizmanbacteria bacterium]